MNFNQLIIKKNITMGCWGYNSDQNDEVCDYVCSIEGLERNKFRSFEKLIDLSDLSKEDPDTILGVLLNYTRIRSADILSGSDFIIDNPTKLPTNYPIGYKNLALYTFQQIDSTFDCQKRIDALQYELSLFQEKL